MLVCSRERSIGDSYGSCGPTPAPVDWYGRLGCTVQQYCRLLYRLRRAKREKGSRIVLLASCWTVDPACIVCPRPRREQRRNAYRLARKLRNTQQQLELMTVRERVECASWCRCCRSWDVVCVWLRRGFANRIATCYSLPWLTPTPHLIKAYNLQPNPHTHTHSVTATCSSPLWPTPRTRPARWWT